jgi:hypothetical protein
MEFRAKWFNGNFYMQHIIAPLHAIAQIQVNCGLRLEGSTKKAPRYSLPEVYGWSFKDELYNTELDMPPSPLVFILELSLADQSVQPLNLVDPRALWRTYYFDMAIYSSWMRFKNGWWNIIFARVYLRAKSNRQKLVKLLEKLWRSIYDSSKIIFMDNWEYAEAAAKKSASLC